MENMFLSIYMAFILTLTRYGLPSMSFLFAIQFFLFTCECKKKGRGCSIGIGKAFIYSYVENYGILLMIIAGIKECTYGMILGTVIACTLPLLEVTSRLVLAIRKKQSSPSITVGNVKKNIGDTTMLLKDLLMLFSENELVAIVYKFLSNGAYKVEELLKEKEELLLKYVHKNGIDVHIEKAGDVVAEDSEMRKNEFFDEDHDVAYVVIEVYDEKQ